MAVGLTEASGLLAIDGIRLAASCAGIRYQGRDDLVVMELGAESQCATVFTQNAFCAAPVILAKRHLGVSQPRYLLINAGNANAGTGRAGEQDALDSCSYLAKLANCAPAEVLPFSTGVIGERLPMEAMQQGIEQALPKLDAQQWLPAAKAMMTTDTLAKGYSRQFSWGDKRITLTGIAKGSGMICPNMATMLAYIATDAQIHSKFLQQLLDEAVLDSFNAISVDGDTSTNDACVLIATGASEVPINSFSGELLDQFRQQLQCLMQDLAQAIVRDAEGATKFVTIQVEGGRDQAECRQLGYAIAHSPLVKTALFASDPNWGRILAVIGRAGLQQLDVGQVSLWINEVQLLQQGEPAPEYSEAQGQAVMQDAELTLKIRLQRGSASSCIWTSDLSHDYVSINADYRS